MKARRADDDSGAATRVASLAELWVLIAAFSGIVGAWRLTGVCKAAREGAKVWLRTLQGLVVSGGMSRVGNGFSREVWRLNIERLRWERMPDLAHGRTFHACCVVRGEVVVVGGHVLLLAPGMKVETTASVEMLKRDSAGNKYQECWESPEEENTNVSKVMPPLSLGPIAFSTALAIDEIESDQGQVLLIGGQDANQTYSSRVHVVDLATGACTPQPSLLSPLNGQCTTAARLADGRVVCVGISSIHDSFDGTVQVLEPPEQGSPAKAGWLWRRLPGTTVGHHGGGTCVLSDGRFAVFGIGGTVSCEALTLNGDDTRWDSLPPLREERSGFTCAAIGGCVIAAGSFGNHGSRTVEIYEEALRRWRRLPCDIPQETDPMAVPSGCEIC
jgi:hypothetical protein